MTEKEIEKIYNEGYRAVYWTAMSLLRNEADAEDVVQDTFVSFIESYGNIEDTTKVIALLKKIAANKSLNRLKSARTENVDDEVLENLETVPEDFLPDSIVESDAMRRIVMDIIENSLSEDVRRTIILFYFDEMSTKEISELLGVPQGTVLWRLNFARKKIKKEVEKYEEESNTKLFAVPLPFLTQLFNKEAEQVVIKPMPASLLRLSASSSIGTASAEAGKKIASEAVTKGTGIMIKKLLIGLAAVLAVGAIATVVLITLNHQKDKNEETSKNAIAEITSEEDITESIEGVTGNGIKNIPDNTTSEAEDTTTESTDETTEDNNTVTNVFGNSDQTNPSGTVFISFEGKTADEVMQNIIEISRTPKDTTLNNYGERFITKPDTEYTQDAGTNYAYYYWNANATPNPEGEISNIGAHIERDDDGTLKLGSRVTITIVASDRARWEELYTASCEALMKLTGRTSLRKFDSGDNESSIYSTYSVAKRIDGAGNYCLMLDIPLRDPAEEYGD